MKNLIAFVCIMPVISSAIGFLFSYLKEMKKVTVSS